MAYCTAAQVKAVVDTDMADAEVTELIEETDAWMDLMLPTGSLNATVLRLISRTGTAYRVMLKDPNSRSLGEYSEDRGKALDHLANMWGKMLSSGGGGISVIATREELG